MIEPVAAGSVSSGVRRVPQAWLDRAMLIEAAAEGLVSIINDAIQRAKDGSGRLYAANILQMDKWATEVLEAIALPEPVLPLTREEAPREDAGDVARLRGAVDLGPYATCVESEGFSDVQTLVGRSVYIAQDDRLIVLDKDDLPKLLTALATTPAGTKEGSAS